MDVAQRDRRYLARDEAAEGVQFARSESSFIFDQHGKKYLDFTVGWCVGNLGVLIHSTEFMIRVRDACRKHGTLFIMDEVATEFGRTGKLFASEHFKLDPDILCLAKAITAGYAPMGATLVTKAVADAARK